MTEKKLRDVRQFAWPADGHRLTVYLNCYLNVAVREDKFKDYVAAGLMQVANELKKEAADERNKYLREQIKKNTDQIMPLSPEEQREIERETKTADKTAEREEKKEAAVS